MCGREHLIIPLGKSRQKDLLPSSFWLADPLEEAVSLWIIRGSSLVKSSLCLKPYHEAQSNNS